MTTYPVSYSRSRSCDADCIAAWRDAMRRARELRTEAAARRPWRLTDERGRAWLWTARTDLARLLGYAAQMRQRVAANRAWRRGCPAEAEYQGAR